MHVFVAFHGCWFQECQYFPTNFSTFAFLNSWKSIFAKEFQYFWVPSICARLIFCTRIECFFNDFDVDDMKMLTFMQVFVALHGCWFQEFEYFLRNFNTFAFLKSWKSIFAKEFQYFWVPSICPRLTFCTRVMLFQWFWWWWYQNVNFYAGFCSIPWMLISGISIFPNEFQYFCVLEIVKINIC